jgi:hypothetical protein
MARTLANMHGCPYYFVIYTLIQSTQTLRLKKDRAKTKPQDKTPILTQSLVPTTPLITHSHIVSDTTTPEKPMLIANQADPETESALIQVESGIISSENTDKKEFSLTWQKIWWGNDFALCIILTVIYWITSAQSIGDYFLGPIQVIIIVQLFFVPVWAVIIVSIKLLNKYK